jgi:hypothetical protein
MIYSHGRYLPEGLEAESEAEFQFVANDVRTKSKAWMIRDVSKLLFRIVEDHDQKSRNRQVDTDVNLLKSQKGYCKPVILEGYTDRPEWKDAEMKVHLYGNAVPNLNAAEKSKLVDSDLKLISGEGTYVESAISAIKEANYPKKMLLMGNEINHFIFLLFIISSCLIFDLQANVVQGSQSRLVKWSSMLEREDGYVCLFLEVGIRFNQGLILSRWQIFEETQRSMTTSSCLLMRSEDSGKLTANN